MTCRTFMNRLISCSSRCEFWQFIKTIFTGIKYIAPCAFIFYLENIYFIYVLNWLLQNSYKKMKKKTNSPHITITHSLLYTHSLAG